MKESKENLIMFNHFSPEIFEKIMQYLYTGEVQFTDEEESNLELILNILQVADEFLLDEIKVECEKLIIKNLTPSTFYQIYYFAT